MKLTATRFDRAYYDEHKAAGLDYAVSGEWQENYARWIVGALGLSGRYVLDVGCACGAVCEGFRKAGARVAGVDLSAEMIDIGRKAFPLLAIAACDATNLYIVADESQDLYHSAQVGEHLRPELVPAVLSEAARVLRPGGLAFFVADTADFFARRGTDPATEDPTNRCIRPLAWWKTQFAAAGFEPDVAAEARLRSHPLSYLREYDWDLVVVRKPVGKTVVPAELPIGRYAAPRRSVVTLDGGGIGDALCAAAAAVAAGADASVRVPPGKEEWVGLFADVATELPLRLGDYGETDRTVPRWEWWARSVGVEAKLPDPKPLPADAMSWAIPCAGRVAIAPYAKMADRTWPVDKWVEVERHLLGHGLRCVILADRGECVTRFASDKLVGESPARVAAVIRHAACFVGNDSGLAHVAGWLRTPGVCVTSPASDTRITGLYPTVREVGGTDLAALDPAAVVEAISERIKSVTGDFPADEFAAVLSAHDRDHPNWSDPAYRLATYPAFWRTFKRLNPRRVVEIGTRAGYSAWAIRHACPEAEVIAFDADVAGHGGYVGAHEHARRINPDRFELTIADSHTLTQLPPCDMAWVDGDHSEAGAYADLELCERSGVPRVLLDDVSYIPDVKRAADRFCAERHLTPEFVPSRTGMYLIDLAAKRDLLVLSGCTPGYDPDGIVAANHRRFATLAGHRQEFLTSGFDPVRPPAWSKLQFILDALGRAPLVFWIDADAVFLRPTDLTPLADPTADLTIGVDRNGINLGAFFARATDWTRAFLRRVWDMGDDPAWKGHVWFEQGPANHLILTDEDVRRHVRLVHFRALAAQPAEPGGYEAGDLAAHFPGLPGGRKRELLREWAGRLN